MHKIVNSFAAPSDMKFVSAGLKSYEHRVLFLQKQSICAVVRSTPTHCAGVHTVCGEGSEGYSIKSVR